MKNQEEYAAARIELIRMLMELTDEALKYVYRPIAYAYLWTDQRDPDRLTEDDLSRIQLIGDVANSSPEVVSRVYRMSCAIHNVELKNIRKAGEVA